MAIFNAVLISGTQQHGVYRAFCESKDDLESPAAEAWEAGSRVACLNTDGNRTISRHIKVPDGTWKEVSEPGNAGTTVTVSGTTPTITPEANTRYNCGTLTSLTISNPPASGAYSIVFTSGATPTTTSFPATILGLEDFAAEANKVYEINVLDGRAVVGSWAVNST